MKRIAALALALFGAALVVCAADRPPLRVAYCMEPGVCYNRPGAPRAGVVVDWMVRIGEMLGREIEWVDVTQAEAEEMLARNEIDIVGGLIFRTERARKFYYFPHVTGQWKISLYTRIPRRRAECLRNGAVIGNVRSFPITEGIVKAMKRHGKTCSIREYDDVPHLEDALRRGEVDAMLADGISDVSGLARVACDLSVPQYLVTGNDRWDLVEDIERAMRHIVEDVNFVADTGIGISPEAVKDIFNPFAQDGSVRGGKVYEGTGLGLAIVKRLVESAAGTVSVASKVGKGTAFTIELPSVKKSEGVAGVKQEAAVAEGMRVADVSKLEVFIVDDVKMNLTILKQHLKLAGIPAEHIRSFASAAEALAALDAFHAAPASQIFVLTDMWMPEMDGSAFAAAIRRDQKLKDVRIVAVTADADSGESFDISLFDAILTKPVTGEKVRRLFQS